MKTSGRKSLHLRQLIRNEKTVQNQALLHLRSHIGHMAREFEQQGAAEFNVEDWLAQLTDTMSSVLGRAMYEGAFLELRQLEKATTASEAIAQYGLDLPAEIGTELPEWLVAAIELELSETFAEPYWLRINETTRGQVQSVISSGIERGWSTRRVAAAIQELRGDYSRSRAMTIARTETGRALNAGHQIGLKGLQDELGFAVGKSWLSILGNTTRHSHAALDGVTVASADGTFHLGGVDVPYPQHRSLPVAEVANCRCTILSAIGED